MLTWLKFTDQNQEQNLGAHVPTEDYDEYDDDDDLEEVEEVDEDEDVEEVDEDEVEIDKGRRQLQRGRLSEFSDKLTGGAARPGQQQIKKSPFVMVMTGAIIGLTLLVLVFFIMILTASEERGFNDAMAKLKENSFPEAEKRFETFLLTYPNGTYEEQARIGLHMARVQKYTSAESYSVDMVTEGLKELDEFIRICRDFESFPDKHEDIRRFARQIARAGAIVAEDQKNQEALDVSVSATKIMEQYAGPDGIPMSTADEFRALQEKAEAAILKQTVLSGALKEIRGHLKIEDTFAALESRQALVDRYPILEGDTDVSKVLDEILTREKELTKAEDLGTEASTDEVQSNARNSAALCLRTQATGDLVSQGRRVFAVGVDSCYGIDSETGDPLWKRNVGVNPPFMPVPVNASKPALLAYSTLSDELVLLDQTDGSLIWRQSIPSRPSGRPIVFQQQIYLTTSSGELWKISVDTGKAISKVVFNQAVVGPPAITRDEKYMLIAGDQSVIYTLSISPLKCVAVSYIEHRLDSVASPILTTGKILLLCDNDTAEKARLRVLEVNTSSGQVSVRYETSVEGNVRDECLIRGADLFVPSSPQRVTAFSVNDEPDAPEPISQTGANQLENASSAPVFLRAGPGGQVWMASQALRKFRLRTNALELAAESAAEGTHQRPIQFLDQNVFVTTVESYSASVFFTKVDPQEMKGQWRTVVGTNLVAAGPSDNGQSMIAIGDFGSVFQIPVGDIRAGGFITDFKSRYNIPDKLQERIGGLLLKDGRLACYCGGDEPLAWTFTQAGQLEQAWPLPGPPQGDPISLANGIVVAIPGGLHMTGIRNVKVKDFLAAQGGDPVPWKALVALSDTQVLAVNNKNEAVRVEYRESPSPHLFRVSNMPLPQDVQVNPALAGELLAVATSEGNLLAMSTATLEVLGQAPLGGVPNRSPLVAGNRIFVEVARQQAKVFERTPELKETGALKLNGNYLVGTPVPVTGGGFVACLSNGHVIVLDENGNETEKKIEIGQSAQHGPLVIGSALIVIGKDGSLYSVEDILN